jgi:hypothetical protein
MLNAMRRTGIGMGSDIITIPSGGDYSIDFPCNRVVDMTMDGTYRVIAKHQYRLADAKTWKTLESKPLEVEVK